MFSHTFTEFKLIHCNFIVNEKFVLFNSKFCYRSLFKILKISKLGTKPLLLDDYILKLKTIAMYKRI